MYKPYCDVISARCADDEKSLKLMEHDWLTQMALPRSTLIRRLGGTDRYMVIGNTCGQTSWMWKVRPGAKPGLYQIDLDRADSHYVPLTILRPGDWVAQHVEIVSPMQLAAPLAYIPRSYGQGCVFPQLLRPLVRN